MYNFKNPCGLPFVSLYINSAYVILLTSSSVFFCEEHHRDR
jgi:hypothetical protein